MAKHVVMVDDSRTILVTSEMALEELVEQGLITISKYLNPIDMLNDAKSGSLVYDLALLDINMPQMNGLDLAQELKNMPDHKMKPILMLTTESSPEQKEKGKSIGVTGWMVKPFSDAKLVKSIRMVLGI